MSGPQLHSSLDIGSGSISKYSKKQKKRLKKRADLGGSSKNTNGSSGLASVDVFPGVSAVKDGGHEFSVTDVAGSSKISHGLSGFLQR